jgi:Flp pilus assembly protein TadG
MEEKRITTLGKHKKGQSMVEFALLLPLFVLLIIGIFDLGRAFFSFIAIMNAAREGARVITF